ncbi:MAG: retroviral-like aspartic protease family protein [Thiohalocapsa sp.]|jgi:predicted aspartyl protease|uniref:retropepsin-like aspartic protease n=1 Tax=Thiohalocapsa sp. TaxID=2497641 RepID=UPI00260021A9|nr:retropepsin-like aspartic protease [Thiohalocapsa sp.]MCG6941158.1 retroviral-like aspartic protease family protein [Thiohalocapsa sp.]
MRVATLPLLLLSCALGPAAAADHPEDFRFRVAMQEKSAATFYVSGDIDGVGPVELMVDTGSGYTTINEETLAALQQRNAARYVKDLRGVLADGSELTVPVYAIARMRIGAQCWLEDVEAAVFPGKSRQILGLSALRRAAPFIFSVEPPALFLSRCGAQKDVAGDHPAGELLRTAEAPG